MILAQWADIFDEETKLAIIVIATALPLAGLMAAWAFGRISRERVAVVIVFYVMTGLAWAISAGAICASIAFGPITGLWVAFAPTQSRDESNL